jgi:phage tail sheath protein FI
MATAYLTPGLYYEAADSGRKRLPAIRTDIAAFVGVAARGPLDTPIPVRTWAEFQARFGNFRAGPFLAYAVKGFFDNGGQECHIVRVAAPAASTATDPAAVQPADRSYSIVLSTAGFVAGAVVSVRQAPDVEQDTLLAEVDAATRKLTWAHPLDPAFAPLTPMTFETGASAAEGALADGAGKPTVGVLAESPGAWGKLLTIVAARSNRAATRTRAGALQPAAGNFSFVESVAGIPAHSLIKVFQAPLVHYHIGSPDPAGKRIVWDAPLEPAYNLALPIFFETVEFSLAVYYQGRLTELFTGLSLVPAHERYLSKAVGSNYIRVEDLGSPSPLPDKLPASGMLRLKAGRDGMAALQTIDFTGEPGAEKRLGLRTLELDRDPAAVAMPDILMQPSPPVEIPVPPAAADPCDPCAPPPQAPPPPPLLIERVPGFSLDDIARVQQRLVEHCEAMRYRVALLDPPLFSGRNESVDFAEVQTWRQRFDSKYAALYFPWLLVYDPLQPRGAVVRAVPPSGHVAGIYARTDFEKGVHCAPANTAVRWAQDVTVSVNAARQGVLNPLGINCIRSFPGRGLLLYGARTVSSQPAWRFVNVRRLMILIEETIEYASQWIVFEPNNDRLRQAVTATISGFLRREWERGALIGSTAEQAFFVHCDASNNPPVFAAGGRLLAEVGVAPSVPAEFVVFRVGRTDDVLGVTE